MPPKKPAAKPSASGAPSPRGATKQAAPLAPSPPKGKKSAASPPKGKSGPPGGPSGGDKKGLLFAAFEGLIQIHPTEAKERTVVMDEECDEYAALLLKEMMEHVELSEDEARELIAYAEKGSFEEFSFEESTHRQQIVAAEISKKSVVGRRASLVDPSLGTRIARKKSRLDAELEAEEQRLSKVSTTLPADAARAAKLADREKWLAQTEEVRELLDAANTEYDIFAVRHQGKKFETKKVADERKSLESKRDKLQKRLEKLEELEAKYQQREVQEKERVRRCSLMKGVDLGVITGERTVLQKVGSMALLRKQEEQNELLDESMFRQMVVKTGDEFYTGLHQHEEEVRQRASELSALHGPLPPPPPPPPRLAKRASKVHLVSDENGRPPRGEQEGVRLPPIHNRRSSQGRSPGEVTPRHRPDEEGVATSTSSRASYPASGLTSPRDCLSEGGMNTSIEAEDSSTACIPRTVEGSDTGNEDEDEETCDVSEQDGGAAMHSTQ